jgi:hypothetical protein
MTKIHSKVFLAGSVERYAKIPNENEFLVLLLYYMGKERVSCNMKAKHLLLAIILISSCACQEDSLDAIKDFHPEDKYFKSSLVSLHFVM